MEEKQLYAIDRLEQAKRTILLAKEEMPAARKKSEKQLQKDPMGRRTGTKRCKVSRLACWVLWIVAASPWWKWNCQIWRPEPSVWRKQLPNFGSPPRIIPVSAIPWRLLSKECQMPMTRPHQLPSLGG